MRAAVKGVKVAAPLLATLAVLAEPVAARSVAADPRALYGAELVFDIYREDRPVGQHRARFRATDGGVEVRSTTAITLKALFFTVYRFDYDSLAEWRAGALSKLTVAVDDNGDRRAITVAPAGDGLRLTVDAETPRAVPRPLFPTNHWNAAVLGEGRVLNTLTGALNDVRIRAGARAEVVTENGVVAATRYDYTGDLRTSVWYDDRGRWVAMRFLGRDGVPVEYRCRRCQGGPPAQ